MKFSILMIKTCKCGNEFKTKPSSKQSVCNKCLIGVPRKEDITLINKAVKSLTA